MISGTKKLVVSCLIACSFPLGAEPPADVPQPVIAYAALHADGKTAFSFDHQEYDADLKHLPIGVFDSGIGGLTVLEAILDLDAFDNETLRPGADGRRDFENERFIYFGDQANMPYGNYPASGKETYLRELVLKDALFLLGRRYWPSGSKQPSFDKPPVKAIVIACNTATAYGLEDIREAIAEWDIPVIVIGVVEAGARGIKESSDEVTGTVAVMATVGTCSSNAYPKAIGRSLGLAGKTVPQIIQQGSVGLAGAIEEDPSFVGNSQSATYQGPGTTNTVAPLPHDQPDLFGFDPDGLLGDVSQPETLKLNSITNYVRYDVGMLVENYRKAGAGDPIASVVLGCTHFPLVSQEIEEAFTRLRNLEIAGAMPYRSLIAEKVHIVNPAELMAKELFRSLALSKTRLKSGEKSSMQHDAFYISVANPASPGIELDAGGGLTRDYKYGREPENLTIEDTINVPLRVQMLPERSLNLVKEKLPAVWSRLEATN